MEKEKVKFLLLTHGNCGEYLIAGIRMILGKINNTHVLSLLPENTFEEYYRKVEDVIGVMDKKGIIFTDIFGGTTTNIAIKLGYQYNVKVCSGVNVPMLLEAFLEKETDFEKVMEEGKNGIKDAILEFKESIKKKGDHEYKEIVHPKGYKFNLGEK